MKDEGDAQNLEAERVDLLAHMSANIDSDLLRRIDDAQRAVTETIHVTVFVSHSGAANASAE